MNQVQMAAKLYDIRDTVKRFLGEQYPARMAKLGDLLKTIAAKYGESTLVVATRFGNSGEVSPFMSLELMAAAVELEEPSTGAPA